jgi:hypothetical protein
MFSISSSSFEFLPISEKNQDNTCLCKRRKFLYNLSIDKNVSFVLQKPALFCRYKMPSSSPSRKKKNKNGIINFASKSRG